MVRFLRRSRNLWKNFHLIHVVIRCRASEPGARPPTHSNTIGSGGRKLEAVGRMVRRNAGPGAACARGTTTAPPFWTGWTLPGFGPLAEGRRSPQKAGLIQQFFGN